MLRRRVIPCLDVANGRVVKGTNFVDLVDEGDPPELAERYAREGADELVFLDISAAPEGRGTLLDIVERTARRAFVPADRGRRRASVEDMRDVLRAGADKVEPQHAGGRGSRARDTLRGAVRQPGGGRRDRRAPHRRPRIPRSRRASRSWSRAAAEPVGLDADRVGGSVPWSWAPASCS